MAATKQSVKLVEGRDYSFAFYGGAILSHFDLNVDDGDDESVSELIELIRISRFSAPPGASDEELKPAKKRMVAAQQQDPKHRLAIVTADREIENEICIKQLHKGLGKLAAAKGKDVENLVLTNIEDFQTEIMKHWAIPKSD